MRFPARRAIALVVTSVLFTLLFQHLSLGQSVNPQSLAFGSVALGNRIAKTLTITNYHQSSLIVESVKASGTGFSVSTPPMPMTLTSGASAGIVVTFAPPASGTFSGSVSLTYKRHRYDGTLRSILVSASGTGTGSAVLQSITVSPTSASITVGATQQFAATGHYSDGSTQNLTSSATWRSSNSSDATISATGSVTGLAAGSVSITATSGAVVSSPAVLAVTTKTSTPVLQSITVSPTSASITVGATQQFAATGHYSDGSTQNLTSSATWSSSNPSDANIGSSGSAAGLAAGSVNITAASGGIVSSPAAALTVTAKTSTPVLQSITVSPTSASITVGATQQFAATGHYSDGSTQNLTSSATWSSSNPSDANIGSSGSAAGLAAGSVNITAASGGIVSSPAAALTVTATVSGNSFYVSTAGNDSNAGTISSPWRTIQHAANTLQAGDTVYVRAGVYNEAVNIAVSGSAAGGAIRFQSYPGETAIVDGTGLTPSTSSTQGLFNIAGRSYVTIQGFEIRNFQTSSASATPAGIWVSGSGTNIQILNNVVHNIVTTSEANGNAFGIAVYGTEAPAAITNITISGNQVYSCKTGNSETVNVDGNVTNFTISNNIIRDNDNIGIDAIGFEGVSPDPTYDYARNGTISGNTVYNISAINNPGEGKQYDADGIYVDGGSQIVVERNLIYACDLNIEAASEHSGHVSSYITIRSNVIYHGNSVGISIGGYSSGVGGSDHITIVNNTLFENDTKNTGSGELQVQYYATNNVFENNIVYATSQGLFINNYTKSEPNPVAADYNLYYSSLNSASADFLWNGTDHTGFSTYQSTTGEDSHSQYVDPLFLSVTSPALQVQSTSPAVNAGTNLGSTVEGTYDFAGNSRIQGASVDLGAYEQ